jgi:hypothetical protein
VVARLDVLWLLLLLVVIGLGQWAYNSLPASHVPREHPAWCHNPAHIELSGLCRTVKGLEWKA